MFEGLIVKGALMAIGGGVGAAVIGLIGWILVQFILAKYGKKKNGNEPHSDIIKTIQAHHEEQRQDFTDFKDEMKDDIDRIETSMEKGFTAVHSRIGREEAVREKLSGKFIDHLQGAGH